MRTSWLLKIASAIGIAVVIAMLWALTKEHRGSSSASIYVNLSDQPASPDTIYNQWHRGEWFEIPAQHSYGAFPQGYGRLSVPAPTRAEVLDSMAESPRRTGYNAASGAFDESLLESPLRPSPFVFCFPGGGGLRREFGPFGFNEEGAGRCANSERIWVITTVDWPFQPMPSDASEISFFRQLQNMTSPPPSILGQGEPNQSEEGGSYYDVVIDTPALEGAFSCYPVSQAIGFRRGCDGIIWHDELELGLSVEIQSLDNDPLDAAVLEEVVGEAVMLSTWFHQGGEQVAGEP